ncbi:uncharacterized protein LOC104879535 isoform X1 [Vitis vinifera]|uniref:uncharacterized protein LOC104879535 isoform X1 n=1 Tax=Vitis vinifera TaxID=29760 RepID=UPI00053FA4DC|nr:uncharacterized protein LOC104879535 isoform X1 [Vitis vinifera]|eukprot:XP_010650947.1 PREDICTED: uncharacterized protein LOC104879535 isoform X1 [Vitis vinifera]
MGDLGVREMFEYYLYDYLVKNNMGETAEIFRREANLNFDPTRPPPVDAPDGFLHEWWVIFYDMFRSRKVVNEEPDEGSSVVTEEMMETGEQSEASSSRQHEMNEKPSGDLAISADAGLTMGGNELPSLPSTKLPAMGSEQILQDLLSSRHQQKLLEFNEVASRMAANLIPPGFGDQVWNPFWMMEQGPGLIPPGFGNQASDPFWLTEHQEELKESGESYAKNPSEESTPMNNSLDDTVKPSVTHAKGNEDVAGAFMQTVTSDTDASKGGSLVKQKFHNFGNTIIILFLLWQPGMIHSSHSQHDLGSQWWWTDIKILIHLPTDVAKLYIVEIIP